MADQRIGVDDASTRAAFLGDSMANGRRKARKSSSEATPHVKPNNRIEEKSEAAGDVLDKAHDTIKGEDVPDEIERLRAALAKALSN